MKDQLRVACVTMNSQNNKQINFEQAEYYIEMAAKNGADWIVLPELFSYMGPYDALYENAESADGPLNEKLSNLAIKFKITLFAPVAEISDKDQKKVYNTLFIFDSHGKRLGSYRKIHLFHLQYGDVTRSESDGFLAGNQIFTFQHEGWNIACAICYDIRFPELFISLFKQLPFDVLVLPSAFTETTGKAHWELLIRTRSVEYQCYTLAANQTGIHYEDKKSFGHSMIVDPWGEVLSKTGSDCGLAIADISREKIQEVRNRIPVISNKRNDVYEKN